MSIGLYSSPNFDRHDSGLGSTGAGFCVARLAVVSASYVGRASRIRLRSVLSIPKRSGVLGVSANVLTTLVAVIRTGDIDNLVRRVSAVRAERRIRVLRLIRRLRLVAVSMLAH